jgi:tetratricopeptide (TPR) repeat protein
MRAFMRPTPQGGTIPTVPPHEGDISAQDLLDLPLPGDTTSNAPTDLPVAVATQEATEPPVVVPPTATLLATSTPTPTTPPATVAPTAAPTLAPTNVAAEGFPTAQAVAAINRPAAQRMYGFTYVRETWNNCGPANITMVLSHYGWRETQEFAASYLKPNQEDKNVSPAEMVNFVRDQTQVSAITRIGGDIELVKDFIAANIPIIIETGYSLEGEAWLGHYQTVVGYDDTQGVFYIYDSWLGTGTGDAGMTEHYLDFDNNWQAFNRTFIVVYEKDREGDVQQILGDRADVTKADQHALEVARGEAKANQQNAFAWFNMGTAYDKLGQYDQAAAAYDQAFRLQVLPFRMLWYQFGPYDAYFQTGRYDDVMALANNVISSAGQYVEETFYWQGKVYQAQGRKGDAMAAYQKALAQNPNMQAARDALATVNS